MDKNESLSQLSIESDPLTNQAVRTLQELVLSGRLRPGERLKEVELASALGISRGPLREAIQRLDAQGLVTRIPNHGSFVQKIDRRELIELYEVRICLEIQVIHLVAADKAALNSIGERLSDVKARPGVLMSDLSFHRYVLDLSANEVLRRITEGVLNRIELTRRDDLADPNYAAMCVESHIKSHDLLVHNEIDSASAELERHLRWMMEVAVSGGGADT